MAWKVIRVVVASILITLAAWALFSASELYQHPRQPPHRVDVPRYELWGIRDLQSPIQISSLHIKAESSAEYQPLLKQDIGTSLSFVNVDLNTTESTSDLPVEVTTIKILKPEEPDASSLLIGLATTLERLRDALPAFSIWASNTKVRFVVVITPQQENEPSVAEITQLYNDHDILLTLIESDLEWYDQYVSLLAVLHDYADFRTKWTCIMDDDTFFFSMKRVLDMLAKYDASLPYYIGGLSENKETLDRLGYLAFGGAGMFFSMPLLQELRPYIDECINLPDPAGDIRISSCIYNKTSTKLTWEHHLFQMDLHGDVTGFYEAVRTLPISTHHWKTWHRHDMVNVGAVSSVCGNECILQKYRFDNDWIMTNGFSIVKYSYTAAEVAKYVPSAMEHTWADTAWVIPTSWIYTLAPLKPRDEGKIQYLLERVERDDSGGVWLYYVNRRYGLGEGVVRVFWERLG